jgi:hypothetical protein
MHETILIYKTLELHSLPCYRFNLDVFPLQMSACCCVTWKKNRKLKKRWVQARPLWAKNTRECLGGACSAAAIIFSTLSFRFLITYMQKTTYDTGLVTIKSLWATKQATMANGQKARQPHDQQRRWTFFFCTIEEQTMIDHHLRTIDLQLHLTLVWQNPIYYIPHVPCQAWWAHNTKTQQWQSISLLKQTWSLLYTLTVFSLCLRWNEKNM